MTANLVSNSVNTDPEDEVKNKHQIFDTAQTPPRHRHPAKE